PWGYRPTRRPSRGRGRPLHDQVAMREQVPDFLLDPLLAPGGAARGLRAGTAPGELRGAGREPLALLSHGREDGLCDFAKDVECANLMGDVAEDRRGRLGVQGRAIG